MCSSQPLRALLALGNPGDDYVDTRHNLGFLVLDQLASRERVVFRREGSSQIGVWQPEGLGREILLAKPLTYMNRSGAAARHLREEHGVEAEELLVVVDDIDLEFGRLRLRTKGGAGTHNGLKSVLEALGDDAFGRLRIGLGPAPEGVELSDWVLEEFGPDETDKLPAILDRGADCLQAAVCDGLRPAMNRYNLFG